MNFNKYCDTRFYILEAQSKTTENFNNDQCFS
jgi:hypothetical protein